MDASHTDTLGDDLVAAAYILIGISIALALSLGASAATLIARQWRWLAIIITMSFVPAAIILAAAALVPDVLGALGLVWKPALENRRFGEICKGGYHVEDCEDCSPVPLPVLRDLRYRGGGHNRIG